MSRDKRGLLKLSTKGHEVQQPKDVFKDPVIMKFLGLPESQKLVESDLEQALISNLQKFLLELGKGFAFVSRQERLTLEGDHFYREEIQKEVRALEPLEAGVHKRVSQIKSKARNRRK